MPYAILLTVSKLARSFGVFLAYDILKLIHVVQFLFFIKLGWVFMSANAFFLLVSVTDWSYFYWALSFCYRNMCFILIFWYFLIFPDEIPWFNQCWNVYRHSDELCMMLSVTYFIQSLQVEFLGSSFPETRLNKTWIKLTDDTSLLSLTFVYEIIVVVN